MGRHSKINYTETAVCTPESNRKTARWGSGSFYQRSFTELVLRLFAELTLSRPRSFALLRMTGCEGEESQLLSRIGSQVSN